MASNTTGGEWAQKANQLRASKLGNGVSEPLHEAGKQISWAKLDNRERPSGDWA